MSARRTIATIDSLSDERATLELAGGASVTLPRAMLPDDAREGDRVTIAIARDAKGTAAAKRKLEAAKPPATPLDDVTEL